MVIAEPRALAELSEIDPQLPRGRGERFGGYGVVGQPFAGGDILAMRRFPISSLGYGYTAVWHRSPAGQWTFWSDVDPRNACARFFGRAIDHVLVAPIAIRWSGPRSLSVTVGDHELDWTMTLATTPATAALNAAVGLLPDALWRRPALLNAMSRIAARALGTGRLALRGCAPNGQRFVVNPMQVWRVDQVHAVLRGASLGAPGAVHPQAALGDFAIPQRGIFALGRSYFDAFDPARHSAMVTRGHASVA